MTEMKIAHKTAEVIDPENMFQPLALRAMFWRPAYLESSSWLEHIPFAFWLMEAQRPKVLVELGIGKGTSYFAFCQGVDRLGLGTQCFGVDAWLEDTGADSAQQAFAQVGAYNEKHYSGFSRLLRCNFDDALAQFSDRSIDLLHIDGRHAFEAVQHDFERWLPKLSQRAVVVIANANLRERNAGIFKLVEELRTRYPAFEFLHGQGLAVLGTGSEQSVLLQRLYQCDADDMSKKAVQEVFSRLGRACVDAHAAREQLERANTLHAEVGQQKIQIGEFKAALDKTKADLATRSRDLTDTRNRLQTQIEHHAVERGQLAERAALFQELRTELKDEVTRLQAKMAEMSGELHVRAQDVSRLEISNATQQRQSDELRKNLQERDAKVTTVTQQREKLQAELRVVEGKLQAIGQQAQALLGELRTSHEKHARLTDALQEREKGIALLTRQRGENLDKLAAAEAAQAKLEQVHQALMAKVESFTAEIRERDRSIAAMRESSQGERAKVDSLESARTSLTAQLDALRAESAEQQRQIEHSNASLAKLMLDLDEANRVRSEQQEEISALSQQLLDANQALRERDEQAKQEEAGLHVRLASLSDTLAGSLREANQTHGEQQQQIAELEEQIAALNQQLLNVEQAFCERDERAKREEAGLQEKLSTLHDTLVERNTYRDTLNGGLEAANRVRGEQQRKIAELEEQIAALTEQLQDSEQAFRERDEQAKRGEAGLQATLASLSDKLAERDTHHDMLARKLDEANKERAGHTSQIALLKQQLQTAEQTRQQADVQAKQALNSVEIQRQAQHTEVERLTVASKALQVESAELSAKLDARFNELVRLTEMLEEAGKEQAKQHAELATLNTRLATAEENSAELSRMREEVQVRVEGERRQSQAEMAELRSQLDSARSERELLVRSLSTHVARVGASVVDSHKPAGLLSPLLGKNARNKAERKLTINSALLRQSGLFDEAWYLDHYPDVRANNMDPVSHYLKYGAAERRDPGPMFNATAYIEAHPDVAESGINPLLHFIKHGSQEGRAIFNVKES